MKTESLDRRLLVKKIIGLAMKIHRTLGHGFLEAVYRNALAVELRREGVAFVLHPTLPVEYEGIEVGIFQADLIVEDCLVVELKAVDAMCQAHLAQLVNYLSATKLEEDYCLISEQRVWSSGPKLDLMRKSRNLLLCGFELLS